MSLHCCKQGCCKVYSLEMYSEFQGSAIMPSYLAHCGPRGQRLSVARGESGIGTQQNTHTHMHTQTLPDGHPETILSVLNCMRGIFSGASRVTWRLPPIEPKLHF